MADQGELVEKINYFPYRASERLVKGEAALNRIGEVIRLARISPGLKEITLRVALLYPADARHLADALQGHTSLTTLKLLSVDVSCADAHDVARMLSGVRGLRKLELRGAPMGCDIRLLSEALASHESLTFLCLAGNRLDGAAMRPLATALMVNSTLTELNLHANPIGDEGARYISAALMSNKTLVDLNLEWNEIGPAGARCLAAALGTNSTLRMLALAHNLIEDEGARHIASALRANTSILSLTLASTGICNAGAQELAAVLKSGSALRVLALGANRIGSDGLYALAESLETNTCLTTLELSDMVVTEPTAQRICRALKTNTTLTWIEFSDYPDFEFDTLLDMEDMLGRNRVLSPVDPLCKMPWPIHNVLFVGDSGAGKTSVVRALRGCGSVPDADTGGETVVHTFSLAGREDFTGRVHIHLGEVLADQMAKHSRAHPPPLTDREALWNRGAIPVAAADLVEKYDLPSKPPKYRIRPVDPSSSSRLEGDRVVSVWDTSGIYPSDCFIFSRCFLFVLVVNIHPEAQRFSSRDGTEFDPGRETPDQFLVRRCRHWSKFIESRIPGKTCVAVFTHMDSVALGAGEVKRRIELCMKEIDASLVLSYYVGLARDGGEDIVITPSFRMGLESLAEAIARGVDLVANGKRYSLGEILLARELLRRASEGGRFVHSWKEVMKIGGRCGFVNESDLKIFLVELSRVLPIHLLFSKHGYLQVLVLDVPWLVDWFRLFVARDGRFGMHLHDLPAHERRDAMNLYKEGLAHYTTIQHVWQRCLVDRVRTGIPHGMSDKGIRLLTDVHPTELLRAMGFLYPAGEDIWVIPAFLPLRTPSSGTRLPHCTQIRIPHIPAGFEGVLYAAARRDAECEKIQQVEAGPDGITFFCMDIPFVVWVDHVASVIHLEHPDPSSDDVSRALDMAEDLVNRVLL